MPATALHIRLSYCAAIAMVIISCNKPDAPDCFQKAGEVVTEIRALTTPPDRIFLTDNIDLEIVWSDENYAEITGPVNLIPEITTRYEDGFVWISNENSCNFVRSLKHEFKVKLFMQPHFLDYQGAGNVSTPTPLQAEWFTVNIEDASGNLSLNLDCDSAQCLSGSGVSTIDLSGNTRVLGLFNQSLGPIDASSLESQITLINSSSINTIRAKASQYLYAILHSSGDVYVTGDPSIDSEILGNGELIILP